MRQPYGSHPAPWERFERTIAHYTLEPGPRDPGVEGMLFPPLVGAYRASCPGPGIAPTQRAYADRVLGLVMAAHDPHLQRPNADAVRARAGRAYISLVAQQHAHLVLVGTLGACAWDDDLDMRYGVDLLAVADDAVAVGLALRATTERSRSLAGRKAQRYGPLPFRVRTLEVIPHDYVAGPFWLYRPEALVGAVMEEIRAHWDEKARRMEASATAAYSGGQRRPKASRRDFMDGVHAALLALKGGS